MHTRTHFSAYIFPFCVAAVVVVVSVERPLGLICHFCFVSFNCVYFICHFFHLFVRCVFGLRSNQKMRSSILRMHFFPFYYLCEHENGWAMSMSNKREHSETANGILLLYFSFIFFYFGVRCVIFRLSLKRRKEKINITIETRIRQFAFYIYSVAGRRIHMLKQI